jgi:aspartyl/asparaginyl-tRNA synthetase
MSNKNSLQSYSSLQSYHDTMQLLRSFFLSKKFVEVDTQSRFSILAACEDPSNITNYSIGGGIWPLPQTGQMWLEYELLTNPTIPGLFCSTTSYRNEPQPRSDRHLRVFPMFEFETHGTMADLQRLLTELFEFLGFGPQHLYQQGNYDDIATQFNTDIIEAEHEEKLYKDHGHVFFLKYFPLRSQPFWNMRRDDQRARKIDALLYGIETVGSAERSSDPVQMRESFYTISDGLYAKLLFDEFGRDRVEKELEEFLSLSFFPRFGGGIGVHRLMRARALAQQDVILLNTQSRSFGPQIRMSF